MSKGAIYTGNIFELVIIRHSLFDIQHLPEGLCLEDVVLVRDPEADPIFEELCGGSGGCADGERISEGQGQRAQDVIPEQGIDVPGSVFRTCRPSGRGGLLKPILSPPSTQGGRDVPKRQAGQKQGHRARCGHAGIIHRLEAKLKAVFVPDGKREEGEALGPGD